MGVDLVTYRARIGCFISRRNVSCEDEKRIITRMKERLRTRNLSKALGTTISTLIIVSSSHTYGRIEFDTLLPVHKSSQCRRLTVHLWWQSAERFELTLMAVLFTCVHVMKRRLLLSGDIETNPGPLGQHTEDSTFTFRNIINALKPVVSWKKLCVQLNISCYKMKEIDMNNKKVEDCIYEMIHFWIESDKSCSWKRLSEALKRCDYLVLAEKITRDYCSSYEAPSQSGLTNPVPALVESHHEAYLEYFLSSTSTTTIGGNKYSAGLKDRYRNYKPAQMDYPPVGTFSYINLALIKDTTNALNEEFFLNTIQGSVDDVVVTTKVTISYDELFGSITSDKKILLLEGRPGCGKTTLTRKLSKDWVEETVLSFIKYLFLIPLRYFNKKAPINLSTILEYFNIIDSEAIILADRGQSVCFVFDGLDEYIQRYSANGESWFEQVLRGEIPGLSCSTIVVTSRPNASIELRKTVHMRGEVLGFLKEQIDDYIVKSYPDSSTKAEELKAYLDRHPNIKHMCYVPFNLVMINFIYNKCQKKSTTLPQTETDVYNRFTIISLIRYFKKLNRNIELKDLESLPSPELTMFEIISKLAYTATIASKTSITPDEQRSMCEESLIASIANLGILVVDASDEEYGAASHVLSFVHLTHQEFLAAYYASRLSSDEQLRAIRDHMVQPGMHVVLKFFSGITKLLNSDHWTAIMDNLLIDEDGYMMPVNLRALHCVFEAQNSQRCSELFSKADGKLVISDETLTSLDYWVIRYCMESASDTVRSIELRCQLTAEGLNIIAHKLKHMENVKLLKIIGGGLDQNNKLLALKNLLHKLPNLEQLNLSVNSIGAEGMKALCAASSHFSYLTHLNLSDNGIGAEGIEALCAASSHFPSLQMLDLTSNSIGAEGMKALCAASSHFSYLTHLNLSYNSIGAEGMKSLCAASSHFSSLTDLNLSSNFIGEEGMKALCAASSHFFSLIHLNLSYNWLGAEGMEELCASSSHFSSLTYLNLNNNYFGNESIKSLVLIIDQGPPLKYITLEETNFSREGAQLLTQEAKTLRPGIQLYMPSFRPLRPILTSFLDDPAVFSD